MHFPTSPNLCLNSLYCSQHRRLLFPVRPLSSRVYHTNVIIRFSTAVTALLPTRPSRTQESWNAIILPVLLPHHETVMPHSFPQPHILLFNHRTHGSTHSHLSLSHCVQRIICFLLAFFIARHTPQFFVPTILSTAFLFIQSFIRFFSHRTFCYSYLVVSLRTLSQAHA
jgi:hypothetical protein